MLCQARNDKHRKKKGIVAKILSSQNAQHHYKNNDIILFFRPLHQNIFALNQFIVVN